MTKRKVEAVCRHCGTELSRAFLNEDGTVMYKAGDAVRMEADRYEYEVNGTVIRGGWATHSPGRCRILLRKRLDRIRDVVFEAAATRADHTDTLADVAEIIGMPRAAFES